MSWDAKVRGSQRRYFYRSVWTAKGCVKQYIGKGPGAELIAHLDDTARREREEAKQEWEEAKFRIAMADLALDQARTVINLLADAELILQGWHEHHGEWRFRK